MTSIEVLLMVVLGGMGSISGSLAAAVLLGALPTVLSHVGTAVGYPELSQYRQIVYAALLIVLIRLVPDGLFGQYEVPFRHGRPSSWVDGLLARLRRPGGRG
jgi:branched-chain amino acid transport system permease protein